MTLHSHLAAEVVALFFMSTWIQAGAIDLSGITGAVAFQDDVMLTLRSAALSTTIHGRESRRVKLP